MPNQNKNVSFRFSGFALKRDQIYVLQTEDILEILLGKYFYEIVFETDSAVDRPSESVSITPTVNEAKGSNGVWESVDDGKMLIYTPPNVDASAKVFAVVNRCIFLKQLAFLLSPHRLLPMI